MVAKGWMKAQSMKTLEWSAQSPDINSIEKSEGIIKQTVSLLTESNEGRMDKFYDYSIHSLNSHNEKTSVEFISNKGIQTTKNTN